MSKHGSGKRELTPELLLRAYAAGIFPMAKSRNDPDFFWVKPKVRGILPLETFHIPRRLKKTIRKGIFEVRYDTAFNKVLKLCGEPTKNRSETWINPLIKNAVIKLFGMGYAHSVETWREGELVGGLYGISLGGAFFGESMFSRFRDASKVALAHLVIRLRLGGFTLLDVQFITDHLSQFGALEISVQQYTKDLDRALRVRGASFSNPFAFENNCQSEDLRGHP